MTNYQTPINLTDEEIDALDREGLRKAAKEYGLGSYSTHREIFSLNLTPDIVGSARTMRSYSELLLVIQDTHHKDPVIVESTGYQVTVKAWQDDEYIRSSLRSSRQYREEQARKTAEKAANTEE